MTQEYSSRIQQKQLGRDEEKDAAREERGGRRLRALQTYLRSRNL